MRRMSKDFWLTNSAPFPLPAYFLLNLWFPVFKKQNIDRVLPNHGVNFLGYSANYRNIVQIHAIISLHLDILNSILFEFAVIKTFVLCIFLLHSSDWTFFPVVILTQWFLLLLLDTPLMPWSYQLLSTGTHGMTTER